MVAAKRSSGLIQCPGSRVCSMSYDPLIRSRPIATGPGHEQLLELSKQADCGYFMHTVRICCMVVEPSKTFTMPSCIRVSMPSLRACSKILATVAFC